jgi:hypothetical protein
MPINPANAGFGANIPYQYFVGVLTFGSMKSTKVTVHG